MLEKIFLISVSFMYFFDMGFLHNMTMTELREKCGELTDLDQAEVEKLNLTRLLVTDDKRIKCFVRCIMTGLNLMSIEGELTLDGDFDPNSKYKKYFPACQNVTGPNSCEKAFSFQNCIIKQVEMDNKNDN